ncbi:hypothetical protein [Aliikangiella coralliicola]|uniref:Uncharacterized protein n=1 Tax=Aliikangiella coralliicola TaxID=2592383 RepID=A0A545U4F9_9GAMM|nr:hypothetical protein [Aliikangiella coralliicola]TQV84358.1 hypothetical protein FLL46_22295 [Aliikangiella coralliicola]
MKKHVKFVCGLVIAASCHISTSFAEIGQPSDWYLHLDVNGLQKSVLSQQVDVDSKKGIKFLKLLFGEQVFNKVEFITAFGNANQKKRDKALLVQGDFTVNKKQIRERLQQLGLTKSSEINQQAIHHGTLKKVLTNLHADAKKAGLIESDKDIKIKELTEKSEFKESVYAAFTHDDNIIFSNNISEIESLLQDKKASPAETQPGIFKVVVDIQKAMLHAGINLDEEAQAFNFESISAKQLSQVSVSYNENDMDSELQLGLSAETTETATKIKSIVQGLVALKSLTVKNPAITNLLANIRFEQDAGELKVIMSGSVEAFKALLNGKD